MKELRTGKDSARTLTRNLTAFLLTCIVATHVYAQAADIDKAAHEYASKLARSAAAVFQASCKTNTGKVELVFAQDTPTGMLIDFRRGEAINMAVVLIRNGNLVLNTDETQGGIDTYRVLADRAKELGKFPFALISSGLEKEIFDAMPERNCPPAATENTNLQP